MLEWPDGFLNFWSDLYLVFTSIHEVMVHNADVVYPEDLKEVLDTLKGNTKRRLSYLPFIVTE